jgi:hypothetical protein
MFNIVQIIVVFHLLLKFINALSRFLMRRFILNIEKIFRKKKRAARQPDEVFLKKIQNVVII